MAKNQNTFEKRRREFEKKRKAEEKRQTRRQRKEQPEGESHETVAPPIAPTDEDTSA